MHHSSTRKTLAQFSGQFSQPVVMQ